MFNKAAFLSFSSSKEPLRRSAEYVSIFNLYIALGTIPLYMTIHSSLVLNIQLLPVEKVQEFAVENVQEFAVSKVQLLAVEKVQ
jgi:hypothetical protein